MSVVPGAPQNVAAVAGNGTVTVSWSAPVTGDKVAFYRLEKSVDGAVFELLDNQISPFILRYVDETAQSGVSHVFRVSARNAIGFGIGIKTRAVIPNVRVPAQAQVDLISQSPAVINFFGRQMAFSPDGNTIIIGEPCGDPVSLMDAGTVQIFAKFNNAWTRVQVLVSKAPSKSDRFGGDYNYRIIDFSPDSNSLAVGALVTGNVHFFTRTGGK